MNGESLAIIAVIVVMIGMFLRAKKKAVALLALPLLSVPVCHLLTALVYPLIRSLGFRELGLNLGLIVIGVVAGAAACAILAFLMIPTKRGKTGYLVFSLAYQVAIAIAYVINLL